MKLLNHVSPAVCPAVFSFQTTELKPEHIPCEFSHSTPVFIDLLLRYAVGVTMEKKLAKPMMLISQSKQSQELECHSS